MSEKLSQEVNSQRTTASQIKADGERQVFEIESFFICGYSTQFFLKLMK